MNNTKSHVLKALMNSSRILVGAVFVFSSFVKGIDPLGSMYKFNDYFIAFKIGFLEPVSLILAFLLAVVEFSIGIALILGFRMKIVSRVLMVFMSFFTILTLVLALTNPVSDCGCFGDAVVMTNWQTFWKNVVLMFFTLVIFYCRNWYGDLFPPPREWTVLSVFALIFFITGFWCYRTLPVIDFRPYRIGTNIPDKMVVPEGSTEDVYKTYLYYEKNGEVQEFTEENFPWQDTTWKFVDSKHVLVSKGYEPPIHDFTIVDRQGNDITDLVLSDRDYSMLLISQDITGAGMEALRKANKLAVHCQSMGCSFYCLTASPETHIKRVEQEIMPVFDFYTTDEITLKTIIRSNPGLMLIREGTILAKWPSVNLPSPGELEKGYLSASLTRVHGQRKAFVVAFFVAVLFLLIRLTFYILRPKSND